MTVLVGIKCKDGIVIGSDSSATFGAGQINTIEQSTKKIQIIDNKIIVAGTGQIGLGQRFCNVIEESYKAKEYSGKNAVNTATHMCHLALKNFSQTSVSKGSYGALVAYPADRNIHLCEFAINDFQPELKEDGIWYVSMGGGQLIADPFLGLMRSIFWEEGMPLLQEGIFIATWALMHTIEVNAGGVGGEVQMAILTNNAGSPQARFLTNDELIEHKQNVSGAVDHMLKYRRILNGEDAPQLPDAPAG